jgi:predicted MFS family arabinose efflux permease
VRASIFPGWWQVVVAMLVQAASAGAVFTAFSIIAVPLQATFDSSRAGVMMAITVSLLVIGVMNPLIGAAMDRYPLRSLLLIGAASLVMGFFALSFTANLTQAVSVYAVFMAVGMVLLGPLAASTLLARWFQRRRGFAMGIAASGAALGGLVLPPILQALIDAFEWRPALRIFAGLLFLITIPAIMLLTIDRPADRNLFPDGDRVTVSGATPRPEPARLQSAASALRNPNFWFITVVLGLIFAGSTALSANLVPLVIEKGITAERAALLLSILSMGSFVGKMAFAGVGDRVDLRLTLGIGLVLQTLGLFGFLRAGDYPFLVAASFVFGLAIGSALPIWGFAVARTFGAANIGRVMGLMTTVVTGFNLSAPLLFGLSFDRTGNYNAALTATMVLLVIAIGFATRIRAHGAT